MIWGDFIALVVAGLACGFVDSSLGMEHGVTFVTGILLNLQLVTKMWST